MTTTRQLVTHLDDLLSIHVTPRLGSTIRQLHDWTGGLPGATSLAAPDTSRPGTASDGLVIDQARAALERIAPRSGCHEGIVWVPFGDTHGLLDRLTLETLTLGLSVRAEWVPKPAPMIAARLAFIQWQVNQIKVTLPPKSERELIEQALRHTVELANICDQYPSLPPRMPMEGGCVAHRAIGERAVVSDRHKKHSLCGSCGQWCLDTGQTTVPPEIVRMLGKGRYRQARRADVLKRYGVKVARNPDATVATVLTEEELQQIEAEAEAWNRIERSEDDYQ